MQSTGTSSGIRRLLAATSVLPIVAALALACGGGDSDDGEDVTSPTPTSAQSPVITVSATPAGSTAAPSDTPAPAEPTPTPVPEVDVIPVEPFDVQTAEAINVRDTPSTAGNVVGILFPGEKAKVLGEAHGEAVEAGDDTWYKVELTQDGATVQGFVYAPYVAPAS